MIAARPTTPTETGQLADIPIRAIDRNPENPRIVFRPAELDQLMESIRLHGVQVPISVYRKGRRYVLIDGERRYRCCLKLNKTTIPALVQQEPAPLTNLLLMFNIHALREQWDLLTIAMKLPRVRKLLEKDLRKAPTERELATHTGLSQGVIRRSRLLEELPEHYKEMILAELRKPKSKQIYTEDFFIEMERALKTVARAMPDVLTDRESVRRTLIDKFASGAITNRVHFRQVGKIARAKAVNADEVAAKRALFRLFDPTNDYGISDAYAASVSSAYYERDLLTRIDGLIDRLDSLTPTDVDDDLRDRLRRLLLAVEAILKP